MASPFTASPIANDSRASLPVQGTVENLQQTGDDKIRSYRVKRTIWTGPYCALESLIMINGIKRSVKKKNLTEFNECLLECDISAMILFNYKFGKGVAWNKNAWAKITQSNIFKYQKFFKAVLQWFFDPEYKDLFYYESERLYINPAFSSLSLLMTDGYTGKVSRLKAFPRIVKASSKTDREVEGILLMIEDSSYSCELNLEHLQTIDYILNTFNFQIEISTAMEVVANRENYKEIIEAIN